MSAETKASGTLATRYACALLDLAQTQNALPSVKSDLESLSAMMKDSADLRALVRGSALGRDILAPVILTLSHRAGFHALTTGFLGTLIANGRFRDLSAILTAFEREDARRRGRVDARLETAWPLSTEQVRTLKETIVQRLGAKDVALDVSVNRDLIGGVVLTVGSRRIDASVSSRLERLGRVMRAGAQGGF